MRGRVVEHKGDSTCHHPGWAALGGNLAILIHAVVLCVLCHRARVDASQQSVRGWACFVLYTKRHALPYRICTAQNTR
jgi:hypothetical protein